MLIKGCLTYCLLLSFIGLTGQENSCDKTATHYIFLCQRGLEIRSQLKSQKMLNIHLLKALGSVSLLSLSY